MSESQSLSCSSCTCLAAGWCERRHAVVPSIHWRKCQAGAVENLDQLYSQRTPRENESASKERHANRGGVGDRLADIINRETGGVNPCRQCLAEIAWLNKLCPAEVYTRIDEIVERIFRRATEKTRKWYQALAIRLAPEYVKLTIRGWIIESIEEARTAMASQKPRQRPQAATRPERKRRQIPQTATRPERKPRGRPPVHQFERTSQVLQFVWFYVPAPDNGMELRLSMASVARHFTGIPKFVVIGERPSWYDGHFIPLPRKTIREVENFDVLPFRDTQNKLVHAVSSPEVDEKFCWIMDDVYLLKPTSIEDLETPRIDPWYRAGTREWHRRIGDTFGALKNNGYTTHQYATHLPHVFEKSKLQQMFDKFDYPNRLLIFENLYGNMFRKDPIPYTGFLRRLLRLSAGSAAARLVLLDGIQENVLNYQATVWNKVMSDWLQERFLRDPADALPSDVPPVAPEANGSVAVESAAAEKAVADL